MGNDDEFLTRFVCDEPPIDVPFQVLRDEWDFEADPPVRTILEVRLLT